MHGIVARVEAGRIAAAARQEAAERRQDEKRRDEKEERRLQAEEQRRQDDVEQRRQETAQRVGRARRPLIRSHHLVPVAADEAYAKLIASAILADLR